ncbi:CbiX/SirB N-terminal domain-containing protein [Halorubellus sp. PRR65]|uniref:sirohydrochlorin chelatase n=1 Tax=Halorubellus sp. PRR65 TaxID=3098148 RepID=UPI002B260A27|nr:CbiX/SirB N-terminal domain-containing protein [Halorubellus sp. PRR65]
MTTDAILLIGRGTRNASDVLDVHAERLDRRVDDVDVHVATYEHDPVRDLADDLERVDAETTYAVPMCAAHSHDTVSRIPTALATVPGDVTYCEPLGQSPALTEVVADRATARVPADDDATLILVAFGSSSLPYQRQTADHHAARLRERSGYGEVLTCYLLQNPAVECVRYTATNPRAVAVPLFVTRTEVTERRIPDELELDRGGIAYADPLGAHPRITDAVHAEVERQRALAGTDATAAGAFDGRAGATERPIATDGEGAPR